MEVPARRADDGGGEGERAESPQPPPRTVTTTSAAARADRVLRELEAAAAGLVVISETDAPFSPFSWDEKQHDQPFSPVALAAWCDREEGASADADADAPATTASRSNYAVEPVAGWFERVTRAAEAAGSGSDEAERLRHLAALMQRRLRGAVAVRVGAVGGEDDDAPAGKIRVFLVGRVVAEGEDQEEEELGELGAFPPGALVVGLETLQVET
jgi:hypothetical protein